jgi:hypothetical protein
MKKLLSVFTLAGLLYLTACDNNPASNNCNPGTLATVKDLTGLGGCGYVFELEDGTYLEPVRSPLGFCGTPPIPKEITEDPLYNFELIPGMKVRIGYEEATDMASICMAGKMVRIKCIEAVSVTIE